MKGIITFLMITVIQVLPGYTQLDTIRLRNPSFEDTPRRGGDTRNVIKDWFDCGRINFPMVRSKDSFLRIFYSDFLKEKWGEWCLLHLLSVERVPDYLISRKPRLHAIHVIIWKNPQKRLVIEA